MKNTIKRIMATLMTFVMMLNLFPAGAFADPGTSNEIQFVRRGSGNSSTFDVTVQAFGKDGTTPQAGQLTGTYYVYAKYNRGNNTYFAITDNSISDVAKDGTTYQFSEFQNKDYPYDTIPYSTDMYVEYGFLINPSNLNYNGNFIQPQSTLDNTYIYTTQSSQDPVKHEIRLTEIPCYTSIISFFDLKGDPEVPTGLTKNYFLLAVLYSENGPEAATPTTNYAYAVQPVPLKDLDTATTSVSFRTFTRFSDYQQEQYSEQLLNNYKVFTRLYWSKDNNPGYDSLISPNNDNHSDELENDYAAYENTYQTTSPQNIIKIKKAIPKEYVVRLEMESAAGQKPFQISEDDEIYVLVSAEHTTTGTGYFLQKLSINGNEPVEIHVDKWYNQNGSERQGERYTGNETNITVQLIQTKVGKTISDINDAVDENNRIVFNTGDEVKIYEIKSYGNANAPVLDDVNSTTEQEYYVDTIVLKAPTGTITRNEINSTVNDARHYGFYTLDYAGSSADMEANGAAYRVSAKSITKDWGYSGNNLRANKIEVRKQYVDGYGKPVANQEVTFHLHLEAKEDYSDGGIGGSSQTDWTETVTTDENGIATVTFSGLYAGRYRLYEVINGTEYAWNSANKVNGSGANKITVSFYDDAGNPIDSTDTSSIEEDIVLTNTNYYMYFDSLEGVSDEVIEQLIVKARSGSGKKFVINHEGSYNRAVTINENIADPTQRATILRAGVDAGAQKHDMLQDFTNFGTLSTTLATAASSDTVKVITLDHAGGDGYADVHLGKDDGRMVVINVILPDADYKANVKTFYTLDDGSKEEQILAEFNHGGENWSSRLIYNFIIKTGENTYKPYDHYLKTQEGSVGILLAPSATVGELGANWGGTIIANRLEHGGSEIHSEQWDDDIDIGGTAVRNVIDKTSVHVEKEWIDDEGPVTWPQGVTVTVDLKNGSETVGSVELNADRTEYTFEDLQAHDDTGAEIHYTVDEVTVTGENAGDYRRIITTTENGYKITNTKSNKALYQLKITKDLKQGETSLDATYWPQEGFAFEMAPNPALGEPEDGYSLPQDKTATATAANKTAIFDEIVFSKEGTYHFTITEKQPANANPGITYLTNPVPVAVTVGKVQGTEQLEITSVQYGEAAAVTENVETAAGSLVNTWKTTVRHARKTWANDTGYTDYRPASITYTLSAKDPSGKAIDLSAYGITSLAQTVAAGADGSYPADWIDLPVYTKAGAAITYDITETAVQNYTQTNAEWAAETITFTNTFETTEIRGSKTWIDKQTAVQRATKNNTLLTLKRKIATDAEYTTVDSGFTLTWTQDDANSDKYNYAYTNLPKYDRAGNEYLYLVEETDLSGENYVSFIQPHTDDFGVDFTNQWAEGSYTIKGEKGLNIGTLTSEELAAFKFTLACVTANAPMPTEKTTDQQLTVDQESGKAVFTFGTISFKLTDLDQDENGNPVPTTFAYQITETGTVSGIENDKGVHTVELTVSVDETDHTKLNVSADYLTDGYLADHNSSRFTNNKQYGNLELGKSVTGTEDGTKDFTFTITLTKANAPVTGTYHTVYTTKTGESPDTVSFGTDGKQTVTLKAGETLLIKDLPHGTTYTVTESAPPTGYTKVSPETDPAGTITAGETSTVSFVNTYTATGKLSFKAQKVFTNGTIGEKQFQVKLSQVDAEGNVLTGNASKIPAPIIKDVSTTDGMAAFTDILTFTKNKDQDETGDYWFQLEEVLPDDLDANGIAGGIRYYQRKVKIKVTVEDDKQGGLTITKNPAAVNELDATFTNEQLGSVKVTKAFADDKVQVPAGFQIVAKDGETAIATFTVANADEGSGTTASPYTWTIDNLTIGKTITFEESGIQIDGYSLKVNGTAVAGNTASSSTHVAARDAQGKVVDGATANFVNTYAREKGSLRVTKHVTVGDGKTVGTLLDGTYTFNITGTGTTPKTTGKNHVVTITITNGAVAGGTIDGTAATLETVGSEKYVRISGLPTGAYSVEEVMTGLDDKGIALTTNTVNPQTVSVVNEDGTIATATFTNTRTTGTLELKKTVQLYGTTTYPDQDNPIAFDFTITLKEQDGITPISGTFPSTIKTGNEGTETAGPDVEFNSNGIGTVTLERDQMITITGLPQNAKYSITETTQDTIYAQISPNGNLAEGVIGKSDAVIEFINAYYLDATSITFGGKKSIAGTARTDKVFTFELFSTDEQFTIPVGTTPIQTTTKGDITSVTAKDYQFDPIPYTGTDMGNLDDKDFYYVIKEQEIDPGTTGWKHDTKEYLVRVHVKKEYTGTAGHYKLVANAYDENDTAFNVNTVNFLNTYEAKGKTEIAVRKTFTDGDANKKFKFQLKQVKANNSTEAPAQPLFGTKTVEAVNGQTVSFGELAFFKGVNNDGVTINQEGEYWFLVEEIDLPSGVDETNPIGADGIQYDTQQHWIKVVVTDLKNGTLEVNETPARQADGQVMVPFANQQLGCVKVSKAFDGAPSIPTGFQITATITYPDSSVVETKILKTTAGGGAVKPVSGNGTVTDPYIWEIKDLPLGAKVSFTETGMTINGYTVTVTGATLTVDGQSATTAEIAPTIKPDPTAIVNTYTRDTGSLMLTKTVKVGTGTIPDTTLVDGEYTFTLAGSGLASGEGGTVKVTLEKGKIKTAESETLNVQADTAQNCVMISNLPTGHYTVTEETAGLADRAIQLTQSPQSALEVKKDGTGVVIPTAPFENSRLVGELEIAKKVILPAPVDVSDRLFSFEITLQDANNGNKPIAGTFNATREGSDTTVSFDANGKTTVTLHADKSIVITGIPRNATYSVTETQLPAGFTQTSPASGTAVSGSVGAARSKAEFTNTYKLDGTCVTFSGVKTIKGSTDAEKVFTFRLYEATDAKYTYDEDKLIQTQTVTGSGSYSFSPINYDTIGTHYYVIREIPGAANDGWAYDSKVYKEKVVIKDGGGGTLVPVISGTSTNPGQIHFTNTYSASGTLSFKAKKVMAHDTLKAGQYSFILTQVTGQNSTTRVKSDVVLLKDSVVKANTDTDGNIVFDSISLVCNSSVNQTGTFWFMIQEKLPNGVSEENPVKDHIHYDTSKHWIKVTVTDQKDGSLKVEKDPSTNDTDPDVVFTNELLSSVRVSKAFINHDMPEGFRITAAYTVDGTSYVKVLKAKAASNVLGPISGEGTKDAPYVWEISDLPVGTEVTFTETGIQAFGYDLTVNKTAVTEDQFTVTAVVDEPQKDTAVAELVNTYTDEKTSASVRKVWEDDNDRDRVRPDDLTVELLADGAKTGKTVTLDEKNHWTDTITGLLKYNEGKEIQYTWSEPETEGYTLTSSTEGTLTTLTNTHETEKIQVSILKVWEDDNNRDGLRPEKLEVELLADGAKTGKTVTLDEKNHWTDTITGLEKYNAGKEIQYTWNEPETEGYTLTSSTEGTLTTLTTLTNTHETEKIQVSVLKVWEDDNDRDGLRPEKLEVELLADGAKTGKSVTLDEKNHWTDTITGLEKYNEGKEIQYTWNEPETEGYTLTSSTEGTLTTLTNTHETEKIQVSVRKVWEDDNNRDGLRPEKLEVELLAGGAKTGKTVTLDEKNHWTDMITGLEKYNAGKEIQYTWNEPETEGYTLTSSTEGTLTTLTNTHETEKIQVSVLKVWEDDNDWYGLRPEKLEIELLADGAKTGKTVTLDEKNHWTDTITDLLKYNEGKEIQYTWSEPETEGYTLTDSSTEGTLTTLTNTHAAETTQAVIRKIWKDDNDRDGLRPKSLQVELLADGAKTGKTVTLSSDGGWTAVLDGLPKNKDGKAILYTWSEPVVTGYTLTGTATGKTLTVLTNTHETEKTEISVRKVWAGSGSHPESVTVQLYAEGKAVGGTVVLNADNGWKHTWTGLEKKLNKAGAISQIRYTVAETEIPEGYTARITGNADTGFVITNTAAKGKLVIEKAFSIQEPEPEPEPDDRTTDIEVVKIWDDFDNRDGNRPESITVHLYAGGEEVRSGQLTAANGWRKTFGGLPKYVNGTPIRYSVKEDPVPWYIPEYNHFTITNRYQPETTNVAVRKIWNDEDNKLGTRPLSIVMTLNNGMKVVLKEENGWMASISGLPVMVNGKPAEYTWKEQTVLGYGLESVITEGSVTTFTNALWKRPENPTEGKKPKNAGDTWYIFEEYDTPLGVEVVINHVGDCFD